MASDENLALTKAEIREIAEYKKIIEFSEQVLARKHPRVKIPSHLLSQPKPAPQLAPSAPRYQNESRGSVFDCRDQWSNFERTLQRREGNEDEELNMAAEDGDSVRAWDGGEERYA